MCLSPGRARKTAREQVVRSNEQHNGTSTLGEREWQRLDDFQVLHHGGFNLSHGGARMPAIIRVHACSGSS
jgi:hypothetical protein